MIGVLSTVSVHPDIDSNLGSRSGTDSDIIRLNALGSNIIVLDTFEAAKALLDERSVMYSGRSVFRSSSTVTDEHSLSFQLESQTAHGHVERTVRARLPWPPFIYPSKCLRAVLVSRGILASWTMARTGVSAGKWRIMSSKRLPARSIGRSSHNMPTNSFGG